MKCFIVILLKESIFVFCEEFIIAFSWKALICMPCLVTEPILHWQTTSQWREGDTQSLRPSLIYTPVQGSSGNETQPKSWLLPPPALFSSLLICHCSLLAFPRTSITVHQFQQTVRMKKGHQIQPELFGGGILKLASTAVLSSEAYPFMSHSSEPPRTTD